MPGDLRLKICGITDSADIPVALLAGAHYLGFVFFPPSPRCVALDDAGFMASTVPEGVVRVGLVVDANDATLDAIVKAVPLDMLQLHGKETVRRIGEVRRRYGLPVMKAVGVATRDDLKDLDRYGEVADQILVDAKPPPGAALPGGNGLAFDWRLIAGRTWTVPWMLAGGLTAGNVAEAVRLTGASQVDVSSGVESAPGVKDATRIAAFAEAAATA